MDGKAGQASASADDDSRAERALIGSGPIESLAGPESEPPGEHTPYETGPARSVSEASAAVILHQSFRRHQALRLQDLRW